MSYSFSTSDVQAAERFDYFHEAIAQSYIRCDLSIPPAQPFSAEINLRSVDNINLSVIKSSAMDAFIPRPKREISAPDVVFMNFVMEDYSRVVQDGREVETRAGELYLMDTARPYKVMIPQGVKHLVLEMPRAELEARIGPIGNVTSRPFSTRSTEGALALGYLSRLYAKPPAAGADAAAPLARQALDVLALALSGGSSDVVKCLSSPAAVARLRLHHAIDCGLTERQMSCEVAANMAGISTRYANVLLAQEGTSLERLIVQRRLHRCREMLADPQLQHRLIGDIALAAGFSSASHFARSFKETFGITAREFRNEAAHQGVVGLIGLPNEPKYLA